MSSSRRAGPTTVWQKHRVKFLAVAVLAILAWLAYYFEYLPVAREFNSDDAELVAIAKGRAIRLGGVSEGEVGTFRLVSAKRLTISLPKTALMRSPEEGPFRDKASREQSQLDGISCGAAQTVLDAHTDTNENATAMLSLTHAADDHAALFIERADPNRYENGLQLRAQHARLRLSVDLNRNAEDSSVGRMILCRSGLAATLGHAEFDLPPNDPFVVEILEKPADSSLSDAAVFDIQGLDSTLTASSISVGRLERSGGFMAERIACGTSTSGRLLWKVIPEVAFSDCKPDSLSITGIDLGNGHLAVAETPAYFQNFREEDYAHYITKAKSNLVIGGLLGALVAGTVIPWALGQFKRADAEPRTPTRRRRRKKPPQT